jgi:hypothetical protein
MLIRFADVFEGYFGRTTAVTWPPQKTYDFKTRVIGGSRSPLCSQTFINAEDGLRAHSWTMLQKLNAVVLMLEFWVNRLQNFAKVTN